VLKLAVGDVVVYGAHGAGSVSARETRNLDGGKHTVVVLALPGGLSIELPLERANEQLRPLADAAEVARVQDVLSSDGIVSSETWLTRRRHARTKLNEAVGLAEIIRDGNAREQRRTAKQGTHLSPGERDLVRQARGLLTRELALARGVTDAEASDWIDEQLVLADARG
jgi:CarD family transcriptional regulator